MKSHAATRPSCSSFGVFSAVLCLLCVLRASSVDWCGSLRGLVSTVFASNSFRGYVLKNACHLAMYSPFWGGYGGEARLPCCYLLTLGPAGLTREAWDRGLADFANSRATM